MKSERNSKAVYQTPIGPVRVKAGPRGLLALDFLKAGKAAGPGGGQAAPVGKALRAYFERGESLPRWASRDLGGTPFQRRVWKALLAIPYGRTRTYGEIAAAVGAPGAARAVGAACGANPLPLFIPCHRVVAAGGKLGGFSGGLHIKKKLLELEAGGSERDSQG